MVILNWISSISAVEDHGGPELDHFQLLVIIVIHFSDTVGRKYH